MAVNPWPHRFTRANLAGLKGFIVRPRMGPIINNSPSNPASGIVIVGSAGWRAPFFDEAGEPIREDGVNLGTLSDFSPNTLNADSDHILFRDQAKRNRSETSIREKGNVDWRTTDGKYVLSWESAWDRYLAPGLANQGSNILYSRGKRIGAIPSGGDKNDGHSRFVRGAAVHTESETGTLWIVMVCFVLKSSIRQDNDYVEEVWVRRFGRDFQGQVTTEQELDEKITAIDEPGISKEEKESRIQALRDETRKWMRVADVDVDTVLTTPTGDPKVSPQIGETAPWLFNASGNECQTSRMVMASFNGTFDPGSYEAQNRQRIKLGVSLSLTVEIHHGVTVYEPSATISIQDFAVLTGTVSITLDRVTGSNSTDVTRTRDENWELVTAVDYVGDQEVFAKRSTIVDEDYVEDADWTSDPQHTTWTQNTTRSVDRTYDFNGRLVSTLSHDNPSVSGEKDNVPPFNYTTGADCTIEGSPVPADADHSDDEDLRTISTRWLDLRQDLIHYVQSVATHLGSRNTGWTDTKQVDEVATIDGVSDTLQSDSDSAEVDPASCKADHLYDVSPSESSSDSDNAVFLTSHVEWNGVVSASNLALPLPSRVAWDKDEKGVVVGSALLGLSFIPFGETSAGKPYGHETVFNRYDDGGVQNIFAIQPVDPGDVFVCYPLAYIGA